MPKNDSKYRTEKAMKEAIRLLKKGEAWRGASAGKAYEVYIFPYDPFPILGITPVAIFDLRDCIKLRAPLKGFNKAMRKAIAPKGKK